MSWQDFDPQEELPTEQVAEQPSAADRAAEQQAFEALTLAQAAGLLRRAPRQTWRSLVAVMQTPTYAPAPTISAPPVAAAEDLARAHEAADEPVNAPLHEVEAPAVDRRQELLRLAFYIAGFGLAWWGGLVMLNAPIKSEETSLNVGAPYLLIGFLLWLAGEWLPDLLRRWRSRPLADDDAAEVERLPVSDEPAGQTPLLRSGDVARRAILAVLGTAGAIAAWKLNAQNTFTLLGVIGWLASIIFWLWALAPGGWSPLSGLRDAIAGIGRRVRGFRWSWTAVALLLIILVGAYFRLNDLSSVPPEMTSDHVEKLIDSWQVSNGNTQVFFAGNGGREPLQMYLMALLARVPGLEMGFDTLRLLTALEGIITLPILWWMGREVIGKDDRRLGNWVGLALAALVAVSAWHEILSRMGLRIVLTPLVTALLMIYLARAMRFNRRKDYLAAGLVLGFGLYTYQAVRMLPLVVLVAVGLAFVFKVRTARGARWSMLANLAALVLIAFIVFVPLFGFSLEYPEDFWRRTSGRLFGDGVTQTIDEAGNIILRSATLEERVEAFSANIPIISSNLRSVLLMFNYSGDVAWINNVPNLPALDAMTGGLLIVGLAAWLARLLRRRDPVDWLIVPMILIMLLPSALAIAYPIENPSHTRASGALPGAYLVAALPLALMAGGLWRVIGGGRRSWVGAGIAALAALGLIAASFTVNWNTFFDRYRTGYMTGSLPYSAGGDVLRAFANNEGSYGNAFMIAYPYWWDHRALGIEGGRIDWPNTILSVDAVPEALRQGRERADDYQLDVSRDLLFFYSTEDAIAQAWLQTYFPNGFWQVMQTYYPNETFNLFRVPALGEDGFNSFLERASGAVEPVEPAG